MMNVMVILLAKRAFSYVMEGVILKFFARSTRGFNSLYLLPQ